MSKYFKHKHFFNLSCEILSQTRKGFRVKQKEILKNKKVKETIQYYQSIDFDKEKGMWTEIV